MPERTPDQPGIELKYHPERASALVALVLRAAKELEFILTATKHKVLGSASLRSG